MPGSSIYKGVSGILQRRVKNFTREGQVLTREGQVFTREGQVFTREGQVFSAAPPHAEEVLRRAHVPAQAVEEPSPHVALVTVGPNAARCVCTERARQS